jgi:hypothetical protein
VAAGKALIARGNLSEGLGYCARGLDLRPNERRGYGIKRWLASRFRIREAVAALISDFKSYSGEDQWIALEELLGVMGKATEDSPGLQWWERRGTHGQVPEARMAQIVLEVDTWWQKHGQEFRNLAEVVVGNGVLIDGDGQPKAPSGDGSRK